MPISLGSNISSLIAQRRLAEGTADLAGTFERLSSGMRINRASDDAAGLAIADSLKADTRVSKTAIRNTNDAISVINLIDTVLASQQQILTRMSELAEQSANGVYTYQQRKALDGEYQSLMKEFDRIAESTEFNGQKLLRNSEKDEVSFQIGISGESDSLLSVTKANSHSLSGVMGIRADFNGDGRVTASDAAFGYITGANTTMVGEAQGQGLYFSKVAEVVDSAGIKREIKFYFHHIWSGVGDTAESTEPIAELNYRAIELNDDGTRKSFVGQSGHIFQFNQTYALTFSGGSTSASITFNFSDVDFQRLDTLTTEYGAQIWSSLPVRPIISSPVVETAIGFTNIRWQTDAKLALTVLDNRRHSISLLQSEYGTVRSRLEIAAGNLSVSSENFSAAESRIRDADIAMESSRLLRTSILQQAAASVLAQANVQPSMALDLLR